MTHDLVFEGEHVVHIRESACATWQQDYAIADRYVEGYVYAPKTPRILCRLFRANHESWDKSPTHRLVHVEGSVPMLCCLREIGPGEEVTFDYFAKDTVEVSPCPPDGDDSQVSGSISLSSLSGDTAVDLTGNGLTTNAGLNIKMETKFARLKDVELCPRLAF